MGIGIICSTKPTGEAGKMYEILCWSESPKIARMALKISHSLLNVGQLVTYQT